MKPAIIGWAVSMLVSCSGRSATPDLAGDEMADSSEAAVMRLISEPTCTDDSQCRTVGIGASPCGGPTRYLIYSTIATDSVRLVAAVAAYNAREARRASGIVGTCVTPAPPSPACVARRCSDAR